MFRGKAPDYFFYMLWSSISKVKFRYFAPILNEVLGFFLDGGDGVGNIFSNLCEKTVEVIRNFSWISRELAINVNFFNSCIVLALPEDFI